MGNEVKGVWFVTARRFVLERHGPKSWEQIVERVPEEYRDALWDPLASEWFPESVLQGALRGMDEVLAESNEAEFASVVEECTRLAIHSFFRVLLRLSTPGFVLRQVPTMWKHIRRGPGRVRIESRDEDVVVRYSDFPYFDDRRYRVLTTASLRSLVRLTTKRQPEIDIVEAARDRLSVSVRA